MSELEDKLAFHLTMSGPDTKVFEREYRFAAYACGGPGKGIRARLKKAGLQDWRFDFAWPDLKLAVEVEGGTWNGGRHTRGKGFEEDCIKYNAAMLLGWNVARFTSGMITSGKALETIELLLTIQADHPQ